MYSFDTKISASFDEAVQKVTEELKKEGFGIITEIDVKKTMKEKLDVDRKPYKILGACNPSFANEAINREPDIGLLLPCNVVVREDEPGKTTVSFMDPEAVLGLVPSPEMKSLGAEVKQRLLKVRDAMA